MIGFKKSFQNVIRMLLEANHQVWVFLLSWCGHGGNIVEKQGNCQGQNFALISLKFWILEAVLNFKFVKEFQRPSSSISVHKGGQKNRGFFFKTAAKIESDFK